MHLSTAGVSNPPSLSQTHVAVLRRQAMRQAAADERCLYQNQLPSPLPRIRKSWTSTTIGQFRTRLRWQGNRLRELFLWWLFFSRQRCNLLANQLKIHLKERTSGIKQDGLFKFVMSLGQSIQDSHLSLLKFYSRSVFQRTTAQSLVVQSLSCA